MKCRNCFPVLATIGSLLAVAPPSPAQPVEETRILALLTDVRGDVKVAAPDGEKRPAHDYQAVAEGQRLELADGASVRFVCTTGEVRRRDESFEMGPEICRSEWHAAEQLVLHFGSLELIFEARGDPKDFDRQPVLLSPRCPEDVGVRLGCHRLLDPPATVRWVEVADAEAYHLELTGQKRRFERITVEESDVQCLENETFRGRRVCSRAWPAARWSVVPGELYRLEVVAVRGSEWIRSGKTILYPLSGAEARPFRGVLEALGSEEESSTRAAVYLGAELFQEAARQLESAETSVGRDLTLGKVYLRLDHPELALETFRRALAACSENELRWRAEQGIRRALDYDWSSTPLDPLLQNSCRRVYKGKHQRGGARPHRKRPLPPQIGRAMNDQRAIDKRRRREEENRREGTLEMLKRRKGTRGRRAGESLSRRSSVGTLSSFSTRFLENKFHIPNSLNEE